MLKLEKLELRGFKSFCEPTEVDLTNGITAIVGPNGCGKSNLADAVTWVLGEQSARSLRGGKMEDVIFQGSRSRQPVGMAEVILTMVATQEISTGNGNGHRPLLEESEATDIDPGEKPGPNGLNLLVAPGECLTISRRLYRSGESEYLLNGRRVRLRDIYDLFAGTGLGPGHYAIIGQGHVAEILTAKPYERRSVIESAAGITRFRLRQRSIELRLDSAKLNLTRTNDLLLEMERQVRTLKRQGAKARRFRRMKEELRALLRVFLTSEYRRVETELEEIETKSQAEGTRRAELEADIAHLEGEYRNTLDGTRGCESALSQARDHLAALEVKLERTRNQQSSGEVQIHGLENRRGELERDGAALRERLTLVEKEITRTTSSLESLQQGLAGAAQSLMQQEVACRAASDETSLAEHSLEQLRQKVLEETNNTANLRNAHRQVEESLQRLEQQLKTLSGERQRTSVRRAELSNQLDQMSAEMIQDRARLEALAAEAAHIDSLLKEARAAKAAQAQELASLERDLTAAQERLASLLDLDRRHAYYAPAVQSVFQHGQDGGELHLLGTLADFVHAPRQYERAIETFVADRLQCIVVPAPDDARRAIRLLEESNAGRATFLVVGPPAVQCDLAGASSDDENETPPTVLELMGLEPALAQAFAQAFPDLAAAQLVADLETAFVRSMQTPDTHFVTPEGHWARAGRVLTGGGDGNGASGLLALKRQITDLGQRVSQLEQLAAAARQQLAATEGQIAEYDERLDQLNAMLRDEERQGLEKSLRLAELQKEIGRADQHLKVIEVEEEAAAEDRSDLIAKQTRLHEILGQAQAQLTELEVLVQQAHAHLAERRASLDQLSQDLSAQRSEVATHTERHRSVEAEVRRLKSEKTRTEEQAHHIAFEIARVDQEMAALRAAAAQLELTKERLEGERLQAQETVAQITNDLERSHTQTDELNAHLDELRMREREAREHLAKLDVRRAELISEGKHIAEICMTELAQPLVEMLALTDGGPPAVESPVDCSDAPAVKERVEALRRDIEEIGPVNMMALEELDEQQQRFDFLQQQREDVLESIASTERALTEIKQRSRQRFLTAFHAINQHFTEIFQELFGGGQGRMVLLDEENPLESGIEIIAQPPGKRLQNIMLLSGGEKTMTAIALLLGIFRHRPSPFCLLDEVDAPLDDMNIGRFADKIAEMSGRTQFILITHNKNTIQIAGALHGVTMEEPGVSKLVSVRLE